MIAPSLRQITLSDWPNRGPEALGVEMRRFNNFAVHVCFFLIATIMLGYWWPLRSKKQGFFIQNGSELFSSEPRSFRDGLSWCRRLAKGSNNPDEIFEDLEGLQRWRGQKGVNFYFCQEFPAA